MGNKSINHAIRSIERKMNKCPETDCYDYKQYPLIDEAHFAYMESEFIGNTSYLLVFPFFRNCDDPFIDIYIWDCTRISNPYVRFVLAQGYRLDEMDETLFLEYTTSNELRVYQDDLDLLYESIATYNPEYNYKKYRSEEAGMALLHLYFVSHRSGYLEILFKAGLSYLAFHSMEIADCNYIGTSPEEILGIPLKLSKILNQPGFKEFYTSRDAMRKSLNVYYRYASYFKKKPSLFQWFYLYRIDNNDYLFNKTVYYKRLEKCTERMVVYQYIDYLKLLNENKDLSIGIPKEHELWDMYDKLTILNQFNCRKINRKISARRHTANMDFTGHKYSVIMPEDVNAIGIEALKQHNCLLGYILQHAMGKNTILFIRKNSEIDKPFVTVEVVRKNVVQFLGKCNSTPKTADVFQFMEAYCGYMGIDFDPLNLIENNDYEDNITVAGEIFEYIQYYSRRYDVCPRPTIKKECKNTEVDDDMVQLTMYDLYPEVMIAEEDYDYEPGDAPYGGLFGDMKYEHKYKNDIDEYIWENMTSIFNNDEESYSECHDKIIYMIRSLDINRQNFDMLWDIVEAYSIPAINYMVLKYFKKYITDDEEKMLRNRLPEELEREVKDRWKIV